MHVITETSQLCCLEGKLHGPLIDIHIWPIPLFLV